MAQDFSNLDKRYGLTPWSLAEHAAYVTGQYGKVFTEPAVAEAYIQAYEKKEAEFDIAYELQRTLLRQASVVAGGKPQELPDQVKIDWNPRKLFKQPTKEEVKTADEGLKAGEELVKVMKKRGRKAKTV